jgi:hypothetical protein
VTKASAVRASVVRTLLPGEYGWVTSQNPVLRSTGDFTITTPTGGRPNTTWKMTNLSIDTGDPKRKTPETHYESAAISPTGKVTKPEHC